MGPSSLPWKAPQNLLEPVSSEVLNGKGMRNMEGNSAGKGDSLGQGVHGLLGGEGPLVLWSV